jgi:hypothetical protein
MGNDESRTELGVGRDSEKDSDGGGSEAHRG